MYKNIRKKIQMAVVTCKYCKQKFDRDKEPFVQIPHGQSNRYAHSQCYLDAFNKGIEKEVYRIWDPDKATTCFWCHKAIYVDDKDVIVMPQLSNRYVHKACAEIHPIDAKEELTIYLIKLFKLKEDYILPRFAKQLQQYEQEYNFTYTGMLKTLQYWYEVKKHPVDLERGVGIIPWYYKQAHDYYYALWLADQENQKKDLKDYIPKDQVIVINPPVRQPIRRRLFSFLDKDDVNEQQIH